MDINELKQTGMGIEKQLEKIRKRIGAPLGEYSVKPEHIEIEIDGDELQELAEANPNQPIKIGNRYYLAYIKDHTFHGYRSDYDSAIHDHSADCFVKGNKVHFYYCKTITYMSEVGRKQRYRATPRRNNRQLIDLRDAQDVEARLAWCKNCISLLFDAGGIRSWGMWNHKKRIAEYEDAGELMACVELCHKNEYDVAQHVRQFLMRTIEEDSHDFLTKSMRINNIPRPIKDLFASELRAPVDPSGYPKNWNKISNRLSSKMQLHL